MPVNPDDVIYIVLLISCIGFGHFYRTIADKHQKKLIGSAVGLFITLLVSRYSILYILASFFVNTLILLFVSKRKCHIASFFFMFSYLLIQRSVPALKVSGPTNMIQMIMTLKVVGLAFEMNTAAKKISEKQAGDYERSLVALDFQAIFHYTFNYIGVLTGPYYSYKTFRDYFELRFGEQVDNLTATKQKLRLIPALIGLYLIASYVWPLDYAESDEFYSVRSVFYRLWYVFPTFFIFRMRIYAGLILSECVCTMAGLGAYPTSVEARSGAGPTKDYLHLNEKPEKLEYDFETIRNMDVSSTERCWTFREAMKTWNMCVQYWMAMNVYKRFPNKKFRTFATLAVSAIWHGIHPGYYFCILGAPFYLPAEDVWQKAIRNEAKGPIRMLINVAFAISKWFAYSYMGIAFLLLSIEKIWHYYSSVYHFGYILWAILYLTGTGVVMSQKGARNAAKKVE